MKTRIIALLLLLAIALTACASSSDLEKSGKEPREIHRSDDAEGIPDVDIGVVDGGVYKNVTLGIAFPFPDGWEEGGAIVVTDEVIGTAPLDLDRAEVYDAVSAGEDVLIFTAHDTAGLTSGVIDISVSLNPLPDADPDSDALVNHFSPLLNREYAQRDAYSLLASEPFDADFCGEDHVVLNLTIGNAEPEFYTTNLYLPCGKLLYTLAVTSEREGAPLEILKLFESLG